jgi:MATE family multidrug resistance protein
MEYPKTQNINVGNRQLLFSNNFRRIIQLATPVMLSQLGYTTIGVIDNIMVGSLGAAALASVSLANSIIFIFLALGIGFSVMITPLTARARGATSSHDTKSTFLNGLIACTIIGILLYAGAFFSANFILSMDQAPEVVPLAHVYLSYTTLSIIPVMLFQAFKQFIDGLGITKLPMVCIVTGNLINVLVNATLIFGYLGFSPLGVEGAAIGTLVSRIVMLLMIFTVSLRIPSVKKNLSVALDLISFKRIKQIFNLGAFSGLQVLFKLALFTALILLAGTKDPQNQAANQIVLNITSLLFAIPLGIGTALSIIHANDSGKNLSPTQIKKHGITGILTAAFISLALGGCIYFFKDVIPVIYIDSLKVIELAASILGFLALYLLLDSIEIVTLGALKGLNDIKKPALLSFIAYWAVGFPISFLLKDMEGLTGLWTGLTAGIGVSALLMFFRYIQLLKKLKLAKIKA